MAQISIQADHLQCFKFVLKVDSASKIVFTVSKC